uniref:Uncharacterized protein n=1 Tax=Daphnia galeata TaxID=27404 RepID=A0A8J2RAI4_9CRUS|nr:unnamed protein product [Daphnia galeata]
MRTIVITLISHIRLEKFNNVLGKHRFDDEFQIYMLQDTEMWNMIMEKISDQNVTWIETGNCSKTKPLLPFGICSPSPGRLDEISAKQTAHNAGTHNRIRNIRSTNISSRCHSLCSLINFQL